MSIVHSLMNKISFKAKTTILVWIIVVGFVLVASVALLALLGLKSEFDTNSLGNLYTPNKNAQEQNKNNQDDIAHLSYMWILEPKAQNKIDNMDSLILHLRKQYAQTFMSKEYDAVKELLQKQQQVRESAKIAITNNDIPAISALLKEQIILSSDITFYNKPILENGLKDTYTCTSWYNKNFEDYSIHEFEFDISKFNENIDSLYLKFKVNKTTELNVKLNIEK